MKKLENFRPRNLWENINTPEPPAVLLLKRKFIRNLGGGIKVAVYESNWLKKLVTVPFTDIQFTTPHIVATEAVETKKKPEPFEDKNLEILKNIVTKHKGSTIKFSDGSDYDVDVDVANAILSIYSRCDDVNKEKMEVCLTKGVGGFMKLAKFAMQNQ